MKCPNDNCEGLKLYNKEQTLEYIETHGFYMCPLCNTEVWTKEKDGITTQEVMEALRDERSRQNQMRKKGSSKKAGRKRKDKVKYKSWFINE